MIVEDDLAKPIDVDDRIDAVAGEVILQMPIATGLGDLPEIGGEATYNPFHVRTLFFIASFTFSVQFGVFFTTLDKFTETFRPRAKKIG